MRRSAGIVILLVIFAVGCGAGDSISQAEKGETNRPGIAETRAIAQEGFIYGLPIVMNYAVQYRGSRRPFRKCSDRSARRQNQK